MSKTNHAFNAEIKQLLDIVIHSLYSQKEIFLRELISNSSDAIDKVKFQSLTQPDLLQGNAEFEIRLEPNKELKTLKIIDNGIGMSAEEVQDFIGTIAKSGTKKFAQLSKELTSRPELIGQFGVGFYSSFMVADKVILHTQKANEAEGTVWESSGDGQYSLESLPRPEGRGTSITLFLKEWKDTKAGAESIEHSADDWQDFTDEWVLRNLVKKYSDFISWPIKMMVEKKKENETRKEDEVLNSQKALWLKSPSEIKPEEYKEFYQHLTHDWSEPAKHIHFKAEGTQEFTALLYFPSQKPWNYQMKEFEFGLNLYIKRVFIMDHSKDILPPYLRFVKGLVDSSDLALNVSRELLQQNRTVTLIKKSVVSKALAGLKDWLAKDRPQYEKFWTEFGSTIKEGIPTDTANKEKIQEVLLFKTTHSDPWTTLREYLNRMPSGQKEIYFLAGERLDHLQSSPYLEKLKQKGYEVLLLNEAIDEWVTQGILDFDGKKLVSITQEGLDLDTEDEKKQKEELQKSLLERYHALIEKMKQGLSEQVKDVVISSRLVETPVCLVSGQKDASANMEKILARVEGYQQSSSKRIMELNLSHSLFEQMAKMSDDQIKNWSEILYNQALIAEGSALPDPGRFGRLISELMVSKGRSPDS